MWFEIWDCNLLTFFCAWTSICFPSDLTLIVSLAISFTSKLNLNLSFSSVKKLLRVVSSILIREPETPLRSRGISCCISTFSRPISTDICLFIFSISLSMSILSPPEPEIVVWKKRRHFSWKPTGRGSPSEQVLPVTREPPCSEQTDRYDWKHYLPSNYVDGRYTFEGRLKRESILRLHELTMFQNPTEREMVLNNLVTFVAIAIWSFRKAVGTFCITKSAIKCCLEALVKLIFKMYCRIKGERS